jgi:hypothetical protein
MLIGYRSILAFCGLSLAVLAEEPHMISTWKTLATELSKTDVGLKEEAFTQCQVCKDIMEQADHNFLREMISQEYPQIALTGFLIIQKKYPQEALEAALHIAITSKNPASPIWSSIYERIETAAKEDKTGCIQALNTILPCSSVENSNIVILMQVLPYQLLFDWFHSQSRSAVRPSIEATVFDKLMSEAKANHAEITEKMKQSLTSYAAIPGVPRVIYCFWSEQEDKRLKECIEFVLQDDSTDEIEIIALVRKRKSFIKAAIDINKLAAPKKRQEFIKQALAK